MFCAPDHWVRRVVPSAKAAVAAPPSERRARESFGGFGHGNSLLCFFMGDAAGFTPSIGEGFLASRSDASVAGVVRGVENRPASGTRAVTS